MYEGDHLRHSTCKRNIVLVAVKITVQVTQNFSPSCAITFSIVVSDVLLCHSR